MKRICIFLCSLTALLLCATTLQAQEPYAALSDDNTVLTFYYDTQKTERSGMSVGPFVCDDITYEPTTSWYGYRITITDVVFDASFSDCTSLTSTAWWFFCCSKLTTIIGIENLKTDNVTSMYRMFYGCSSLISLDVSSFKNYNVTDMREMFRYCSSLTSLDVSGFKTDNVTYMYGMFHGCSGLTSLDVSGFKTDNVTDMSYMFCGCSGLTSLDLSSFKTDNVTEMKHMFSGCRSLTTIYAGNDWSTEKVTSGYEMFDSCNNLVGGQGTAYKNARTDHTYARIDGGVDAPGYFTAKENTGMKGVMADGQQTAPVYNIKGQQVNGQQRGLHIVRSADGKVKKVVVR